MARLGDVFEIQITGEWGNECSENETGTKVLRTTNFTPEGRINYDRTFNKDHKVTALFSLQPVT